MEISTPKPTLDVTNLDTRTSLLKRRLKEYKRRIPKFDKYDRREIAYILHKFRKKQRKMLDSRNIEDPDPYDCTYVFYCFQGVLED